MEPAGKKREGGDCILACMDCPYIGLRNDEGHTEFQGALDISGMAGVQDSGRHFCAKIGGMPCLGLGCGDIGLDMARVKSCHPKAVKGKRERDKKYRRHLQKLACMDETRGWAYGGACRIDGEWGHMGKPYYRRYWRGGHGNRFRYWLRISNRKVRRYKGDIHHTGASYRKIFDYCWTVD